MLPTSLKL